MNKTECGMAVYKDPGGNFARTLCENAANCGLKGKGPITATRDLRTTIMTTNRERTMESISGILERKADIARSTCEPVGTQISPTKGADSATATPIVALTSKPESRQRILAGA